MLRQESAETIALQAFAWLVGNEDLLPVFLGSTGASASDLAGSAQDPVFLASILDFLLMDDAWVMACCDAQGLAYDSLRSARMALPGADLQDWG